MMKFQHSKWFSYRHVQFNDDAKNDLAIQSWIIYQLYERISKIHVVSTRFQQSESNYNRCNVSKSVFSKRVQVLSKYSVFSATYTSNDDAKCSVFDFEKNNNVPLIQHVHASDVVIQKSTCSCSVVVPKCLQNLSKWWKLSAMNLNLNEWIIIAAQNAKWVNHESNVSCFCHWKNEKLICVYRTGRRQIFMCSADVQIVCNVFLLQELL